MNNEKVFTWGELKEIINRLDETHLSQPVRWWGDERGGVIHSVTELTEEFVQSDEGWEPKSVMESEDGYHEGSELPIGTPILSTD